MEDYHTARIEEIEPGNFVGLFAVYDGHGGSRCVQYVQRRLFKTITSHAAFASGDTLRAMYEGYMMVCTLPSHPSSSVSQLSVFFAAIAAVSAPNCQTVYILYPRSLPCALWKCLQSNNCSAGS